MDAINPLIPSGYDIAWSVVALVGAVLAIVALVSLARSARHLSARQALGWVLLTIFIPILGPVTWLAIGRRAHGMPPREA
ncbi:MULTISPECIES: PLD nuclease N-terminal domain-containing protein [Microbacterium]|uniref:Cardiolipin synthase N-terminal domain-containing protein n=1 Tax=Microbacterium oleivorans TaxID=273677 RepID=A0A031FNI6_9MICO|nr:PLD nuclease N-terminal domain-containing protein [Microbacterium oleivorans]AZS43655.1 hypothetical protein BWL13_01219 [Microbacterium oleivorans]AZS44704.1 hypothetical protein BWL13_02298 [Microbacterium oleivorans]EZP26148.1 hypothetical protein BW34_02480 [Microbacterium oleivorans]THE06722.1 PLDc_N domain-containing protein [Microbacterium oleivorans]